VFGYPFCVIRDSPTYGNERSMVILRAAK
jgi:hypothetical protein